jgi:hypothetical protein
MQKRRAVTGLFNHISMLLRLELQLEVELKHDEPEAANTIF